MRVRRPVLCLVAAMAALGPAAPARAGLWITPDFPEGKEPRFPPVPLYWFTVAECPVVYRAEVEAPKGADRATALARTSGYIYVYVDGRLAYGRAPEKPDPRRNRPGPAADPGRAHEVDLTAALWPGRHVLVVSAPPGGFVLDGGLYAGTRRLAPLATGEAWTVTKLPPTTVLEDHRLMKPAYAGPAAPVRAGDAWSADDDALARAYGRALLERLRDDLEDLAWRLDLLTQKGIYLVPRPEGEEAAGWGGPARLAPETLRRADALRERVEALEREAAALGPPGDAAALERTAPDLQKLARDVYETRAQVSQTTGAAWGDDDGTAFRLIQKVVPVEASALAMAGHWTWPYENRLHGLLNRLNECRHDRLGWVPDRRLVDSDVSQWGVQFADADGKDLSAREVLATPLSPCVVLRPRADGLTIVHAGRARIRVGPDLAEADGFDAARGDRLKTNWALLEFGAAGLRPVLLAFQKAPRRIACRDGSTQVRLAGAGEVLVAVRPWAKLDPDSGRRPARAAGTCALWGRAARAVPLNYMSVTRVLAPGEPYDNISIDNMPAGPVLGQTIVYDYLQTADEWGTEALRLAPLPALASFALDVKYRGLAVDRAAELETLQDGGPLAPYRALRGADRVSYQYPIEPFPRLVGFTSWMFAWCDAGVPGNRRELELLAAAGANSYRPQHNFSDDRPPPGLFAEGERRTRVAILADVCNAAGLNYMNNIDQTLGARPETIRGDAYGPFMDRVGAHYEKIARQLADRPFWAVAYDLLNEPNDHRHERYNPAMKELVRRVRAVDRRHLVCIEPPETWGGVETMPLVEPVGDPLTLYSFHNYTFRLKERADRWPTLRRDARDVYELWRPAFAFSIRHGAPLHCGEFGGFHGPTADSPAQATLLGDLFRVFDQFGMHHHYYSGREVYRAMPDGALRPSNVVRAYRAYTGRAGLRAFWKPWPGQPPPAGP